MSVEPTRSVLNLRSLAEAPGLPGLTTGAGQYLADAAAVCLDSQGHVHTALLKVDGAVQRRFEVVWLDVTPQMKRTYNDLQQATEDGAYAIAILLMREVWGLSVVQRSRKGTGIDYWLTEQPAPGRPEPLVFQNAARLEVSGILRGTRTKVRSRMARKRRQVGQSRLTDRPAYVVIVDFGFPSALVEKIG